MVVYNSADKEQKTKTDRYNERIKSVKKAKNIITGETVDLSELTIPAKSILVLELVD
jgi:hypothetical protein